MKSALTVFLMLLSIPALAAFDEKGAPNRLQCKVSTLTSATDIDGSKSMDELLNQAEYKRLLISRKTCPRFNGKVVACELLKVKDQLSFKYYFNTQGGGLTIEDAATGQSSDLEWTTQYGITESGYANVSGELSTKRGGLMGNPRLFRIEVNCYATPRDFIR